MPDGKPQEHTQDVAAPQAPAGDQESGKPSFLERLRELGATLGVSEVPSHTETSQILGAFLKVAEHEGAEVADELFPEPAQAPAPTGPGAPAADPRTAQHEDRIGRIENALEQLLTQLRGSESEPSSEPTPPSPEPSPEPQS